MFSTALMDHMVTDLCWQQENFMERKLDWHFVLFLHIGNFIYELIIREIWCVPIDVGALIMFLIKEII